ncbi:MAG: monooxygenase [Planctomycetia bacterium]|nr:monooxygenase [Planctomycetia bacterium]
MAIDCPARIAVLGAGPIGLETALYARYLGYDVDIYERVRVAENVLRWGHVRMFSPFGQNRSALGIAALKAQGAAWEPPADDVLLTGREFSKRYLIPLSQSDLLADGLHENTEVVAIGRDGPLKQELVGDESRGDSSFRILLRGTDPLGHGRQRIAAADVVIDATGTYGNHNWLGHGGIPAIGELAAQEHIEYGLSDILGAARDHYASRNILLIGAGHSAATNLVALAELAGQAPDTWITWVTRRDSDEKTPQPLEPIPGERLAERERLTRKANRLAADDRNHITFFSGTTVDALTWHADLERFSIRLLGRHAGELEFDRIIANVGFRPDNRLYGELQIDECYANGGPRKLAIALAAENGPDSLDQPSCGPEMLVNPEPNFYILGAKSFGRDSRFLLSKGLEQIRELFTIIGDRADLNLYATMAGLY